MSTSHTQTAADVTPVTRSMAQAARLAPSVHNTQPWRFAPLRDGLAVHEDPDRSLPVLDPAGRLRSISCGAAVTNAALAVSVAGRRPVVDRRPASGDPTLMATVLATTRGRPDAGVPEDDRQRYDAIPRRRTHRRPHRQQLLGPEELARLRRAVTGDGARPVVPEAEQRRLFGSLLRDAAHHQLDDPRLLDEIEAWIRHPTVAGSSHDGIPVDSLGTAPYPSDSLVQDRWDEDLDDLPVEYDLEASTVVAIATAGDTRQDWVTAGMALQRLWLEATVLDLAVTFADQATQWPGTRDRAGQALGTPDVLQVVLRIGYPLVDVPETPRRPLDELWA